VAPTEHTSIGVRGHTTEHRMTPVINRFGVPPV